MSLIRHSIIQRENPMLSNLYQQQVYLIIHLYPHCVKAMRLWTNAVDRGLVQRTPNYIRCRLVMTMTDPIADMLTRLRNANQAHHDSTTMPHSKIKVGIAGILKKQGYISEFEVLEPAEGEVGKSLKVTLKYGSNRERSIAGLRRISKPGLRVYAKSNALPKVLGGMGIAIISTSQGLLTDKEAHSKSVGGEVLAYVW